jgi:ceramidase
MSNSKLSPNSPKVVPTGPSVIALGALATIGLVLAFALTAPISQPASYHNFADQRAFFGIPNFWNVFTNLAFLVVGLAGIFRTFGSPPPGGLNALRWNYRVFFIGVLLTGFGSGYYHYAPSNFSLIADRLPMGIAFMALFTLIIGESISVAKGRALLLPFTLMGVFSVLFWAITEAMGVGDLRPYVVVQFVPMVLAPLILWRFGSFLTRVWMLWLVMLLYLLAKLAEYFDQIIMDWGEVFSGHALKHLFAAAACLMVYLALGTRRPTLL